MFIYYKQNKITQILYNLHFVVIVEGRSVSVGGKLFLDLGLPVNAFMVPYIITRDKVTAERRKLHSEELNDLYSSPNIIRVIKSRRMRWAGHLARMGRKEVGKPEGKRPFGRPRRRWKNSIKMDR
jgi:hypothetical protein